MYNKTDVFVEVAEEILAVIQNSQQTDASYERRKFRHKAHYSLDREDGIENDALARPLTPEEVLEQKQLRKGSVYCTDAAALHPGPAHLRPVLSRHGGEGDCPNRGVDRRRVWASIRRGLKKLAYLLDANK